MRFRGALLAVLLTFLPAAVAAAEELPVRARIGPWPTLSKPVAFDGRLWVVNSVLGVNHNSADLYSFDPATGTTRYERHLFSQDTGDPLVAKGLLYWPCSRFYIYLLLLYLSFLSMLLLFYSCGFQSCSLSFLSRLLKK